MSAAFMRHVSCANPLHCMQSLFLAALIIFMAMGESLAQDTRPLDPATESAIEQDTGDITGQPVEEVPSQEILPDAMPEPYMEERAEGAGVVDSALVAGFEKYFGMLVAGLETALFFDVFFFTDTVEFPIVVMWLILGGVFFTLRLGFVNIRLFGHALKVVTNRYPEKDAAGQIKPFAALSAAVSGTVGLGNIAGVAVAVTMGGPGAVIWMMVAGFLGMSTKFSEALVGHKYRKVDEHGNVSGGAFYYLRDGLREVGYGGLGKILAVIFAIFCLGGSFGGGNMFQSNQTVVALTSTFDVFNELDWVISLVIAVSVGIVLIGGVKRIATVAETIVPLMAFIYLSAGCVVLFYNSHLLGDAFQTMISQAFTPEAGFGGVIGAIIVGLRRSAFSNEAGVGSGPIVMAVMKTSEPVRVGCLGVLEPFIDTIVICFMTGMVITVTGVYQQGNTDGVMLTSAAFGSAISWFPTVLSICVTLFAFSTMITWSYYGERAWNYLFGNKTLRLYHVLFCTATFFGGVIKFDLVLTFSDLLILAMSVPNLLGLYLLSGVIKRELDSYLRRKKAGEFKSAIDAS